MSLKTPTNEGNGCDRAVEGRTRHRPPRVILALAAVLIAVATGAVTPSAHAAVLGYDASAYGTYAFVGTTLLLGRNPLVALGCGTPAGASKSSSLASVSDAPLVTTDTISVKVSTTTTASKATATVQNVNLLNGRITATQAQAVSITSQDQSGLHVSGAASSFLSLIVAGVPIIGNVPPNTTIALAGVGKVVLNEQVSAVGTASAQLTVNIIHVYVTMTNSLGLATGTQIIVGNAHSGLTVVNGPGLLSGVGYGTSVSSSVIKSGPTAPASLPCLGTNGQTKTNTLAGVNVPGVLTSGTITDTATGNITPSLVSGRTTASVQSLNLLKGVVTAGAVTVAANASSSDGVNINVSDTGTSFLNLVVQGRAMGSVSVNTTVVIAGVGTLYLRRQIVGPNSIDERGIELVIPASNLVGLPAMDIIVARATVAILKP